MYGKRRNTSFGYAARRRLRGFTLVELMISLAISTITMLVIASLQSASGRAIKEMYGQTRMRAARMTALDQIRYRLVDARVGSITASQPNEDGDGFHQVDFIDPNLGGVTSRFVYDADTLTLFYDDDISGGAAAYAVVVGPIDISFELENAGAIVFIRVKSRTQMVLGDVDLQDGETAIYVRNT